MFTYLLLELGVVVLALHGGAAPENRNDVNQNELVTTHLSMPGGWSLDSGEWGIFVTSFKKLGCTHEQLLATNTQNIQSDLIILAPRAKRLILVPVEQIDPIYKNARA